LNRNPCIFRFYAYRIAASREHFQALFSQSSILRQYEEAFSAKLKCIIQIVSRKLSPLPLFFLAALLQRAVTSADLLAAAH
jgi:hypothetical protein